MGPLPKLRLIIVEALDLHSKSVLISLTTFGHIVDSRRSLCVEVGIMAADIEEARAFAVLWVEKARVVSYVNEASTVSDDQTIVALIVGNTSI